MVIQNKKSDLILAVTGLVCLVLMCVRAASVLHHGIYVFTSGGEPESLFAVWKWLNKQPVYGNPFAPPFAQSYFNWLFYWVYGAFCWATLSITGLDFQSLPTIGRCLTLALTVLCMIVVYQLLRPLSLIRRIAGSAIVAFSPLIGFWAMTVRPDVGALTFGLFGAWCIGKSEETDSSAWIVTAFLAFYCSWAFKQSYIAAIAAAIFHFALARKWRTALWFGAATVLAFGLTFMLGTTDYRYAAISSQSHMALLPSNALHNIGKAISKAPLLVFGLISVVACFRRDRTHLLALWAIISIPLMLLASAKSGAADNYFFEPAAICSILFLLEGRHLSIGAVAQLISPVLIFAGLAGMVFMKTEPELLLLRSELRRMNGTVLVTCQECNLPWLHKDPPYFVLATTYFDDRALGKTFDYGGVEGMVRSGRIAIFVCRRNEVFKPYDGIVPASLQKIKEDSEWVYFATKPVK